MRWPGLYTLDRYILRELASPFFFGVSLFTFFLFNTAFRGTFDTAAPLRLTYRILGATTINGADGLLLEPLGLATALTRSEQDSHS